MVDLNDFFYFVQVVDRGGFTAAGRTLRMPKSTLSHRIQQLESSLGVRLLNRSSRQFGMTDAGQDFYRHAVIMLQEAERAETAIRHRLIEPIGTVRITAGKAISQFVLRDLIAKFLLQHMKVNVVLHATDDTVDIVAENFDIAVRAHSGLLPDSTLVQKRLASAPWHLFAGTTYITTNGEPTTPSELHHHAALFMMRKGVAPTWRLQQPLGGGNEVVIPLTPRLLSDDMIGLKQAAIAGLGIVALPSYVCREETKTGALVRVLPDWLAGDSTLTALSPYRQGLLPSVKALLDYLTATLPGAVDT